MNDLADLLTKLQSALGPVGMFAALCYFGYLLYGPSGYKRQQRTETITAPVGGFATPQQLAIWHQENRDWLRDTNTTTKEMKELQKEELTLLRELAEMIRDIVKHQERLATALTALEGFLERHFTPVAAAAPAVSRRKPR